MIGKAIGRCRILGEIGVDGMGEFCRAEMRRFHADRLQRHG